MKRLIFLLALFATLPAVAQQWKRVAIDSSLSAELPKGYLVKDSLGERVITARGFFGDIQIYMIPDSPKKTPDIDKKKHLQRYYDNYLKTLVTATRGKVSKEKDTLLGDLHIKDFTLETNESGGRQFRKFRLLHENCATYIFQYIYQAMQEEVSVDERRSFFNSIRAANTPTMASQFTSETAYPVKNRNLYLFIASGTGILAILLLIFLRKRKKSRQ